MLTKKFILDNIDPSWNSFFTDELNKEYFNNILKFFSNYKENYFPLKKNIFKIFKLTPLTNIKVIILGQDPYHGKDQAHGLSFSVQGNQKIPPSLRNIFKELNRDLKIQIPKQGDLTKWANQGVLLLNTILTVEEAKPLSHKEIGWQYFTDNLISFLAETNSNLVFILWGNNAKAKKNLIKNQNHLILESGHPSPLSARFFHGNEHFSLTNKYLIKNGQAPIDWRLS